MAFFLRMDRGLHSTQVYHGSFKHSSRLAVDSCIRHTWCAIIGGETKSGGQVYIQGNENKSSENLYLY